jgi:hypothetical protein
MVPALMGVQRVQHQQKKASLLHRGVWCVIHSIGKRLYIDFLEVLSVLATADLF